MGVGAYLATVLLLGSILEGVLMAVIRCHPEEANRSPRSPKAGGRVKPFRDWSPHECIEVACERQL